MLLCVHHGVDADVAGSMVPQMARAVAKCRMHPRKAGVGIACSAGLGVAGLSVEYIPSPVHVAGLASAACGSTMDLQPALEAG